MTADDGLYVSVTELARLKGVSQPAISKRLKRFIESGLITTRSDGGKTLVNLAEWDSVTRDVTDLSKLVGARTRAGRELTSGAEADVGRQFSGEVAPKDPSYTQELTRKARYDADLKEIELKRQRQELRTVEDITDAATKVGETMIRVLEMLPSRADDIAAAVLRGGPAAVREQLKLLVRSMREAVVRDLAALAAGEAGAGDSESPIAGFPATPGTSTGRLPQ